MTSRLECVQTAKSPAGLVLVSIKLSAVGVPRFDAVVAHAGDAQLAFVILGQVLSIPTAGPELT